MIKTRLAIVRSWFGEHDFRRLWKNATTLLAGNLSASVCDVVTLVLTARLLGVESFGLLVLIQTCVRITDALTNFQSWQAIIKFGADAMVMPDKSSFAKLIKFGTLLDVASATLGALVSVGVFVVVAKWQAWDTGTTTLAMAYGLSIVVNIIGTPKAILRLYNKFRTLALAQFSIALIKMITIVFAFLYAWDFTSVVWVWILASIATPLVVVVLAWREVHLRLGVATVMRTPLSGVRRQFDGIVAFFITTNLSESVRLVAKEFDIVVVTYFGGTASAGIYKIAKQFASIVDRFTLPVRDAVYPEIAKLRAAGDIGRVKSYMTRIGLLCGGFGLIMLAGTFVLGDLLLHLTAGPEYADAYWPLVIYLASIIVYMFGITFQSVLLSLNKPVRILQVFLVGNAIYFVVLILLCSRYGVVGAASAHVVYHLIWFAGMKLSINQFLPKDVVQTNWSGR